MNIFRTVFDSPIGRLLLEGTCDAVTGLHFVDSFTEIEIEIEREIKRDEVSGESCALIDAAHAQLAEYFEGRRTVFDVPYSLDRCGEFQRRVLAEVAAIPFGRVTSYGAIAQIIGRPAASRAVGQANGCNPISLFVPCHRVIGSNGKLTGYGGGLPAKQWLLKHEGVLAL